MSKAGLNQDAPLEAVPQRQIRALYNKDTITVYHAYSARHRHPRRHREHNLCASPDFKVGRMTWIKPSWCWMTYRSNYRHKDPNQSHILALENVPRPLHPPSSPSPSFPTVAPSPQPKKIAIPRPCAVGSRALPDPGSPPVSAVSKSAFRAPLAKTWAREWVRRIEDVTARARELKGVLDQEGVEELVRRRLVPRGVEEEVRARLGNYEQYNEYVIIETD